MVSEKLIVPTGMRSYLSLLFMKNIYIILFNFSIFFFPNLSQSFIYLLQFLKVSSIGNKDSNRIHFPVCYIVSNDFQCNFK